MIVENQIIDNSKCEKLLGVKFDYKLTFNAHIDDICKKAGLKLNALSRIAPYMDFNKKRLLVNVFFMSQFNYCPLIWVCHNSTKNNKINKIHERCLRLIYNNKKSSFENLLDKDKSVSIHHKNLRSLVIDRNQTLQTLVDITGCNRTDERKWCFVKANPNIRESYSTPRE